MNGAFISIVGVISGIGGFALGFLGYLRTAKRDDNQDTKDEASNSTRVEIKLDYAISGINEIKSDIRDTKKDVGCLADRVTRVEESTKSAHHRLDNIEGKND
jgi:hypothetical protein